MVRITARILFLSVFLSACASSGPRPPERQIHCAVYINKGPYGVGHYRQSRNGIYTDRYWYCDRGQFRNMVR